MANQEKHKAPIQFQLYAAGHIRRGGIHTGIRCCRDGTSQFILVRVPDGLGENDSIEVYAEVDLLHLRKLFR